VFGSSQLHDEGASHSGDPRCKAAETDTSGMPGSDDCHKGRPIISHLGKFNERPGAPALLNGLNLGDMGLN